MEYHAEEQKHKGEERAEQWQWQREKCAEEQKSEAEEWAEQWQLEMWEMLEAMEKWYKEEWQWETQIMSDIEKQLQKRTSTDLHLPCDDLSKQEPRIDEVEESMSSIKLKWKKKFYPKLNNWLNTMK